MLSFTAEIWAQLTTNHVNLRHVHMDARMIGSELQAGGSKTKIRFDP
jgi:hypothetical protein